MIRMFSEAYLVDSVHSVQVNGKAGSKEEFRNAACGEELIRKAGVQREFRNVDCGLRNEGKEES
jgi:hypothetical protein